MYKENPESYKKIPKFDKIPKSFERKIIASPEDYIPLSKECKVIGAFNPGVAQFKTEKGLETILMIRVAESPSYKHPFWLPFFHIPNEQYSSKLEMDFDKYSKRNIKEEHEEAIQLKDDTYRLKHISLPRLLRLNEKGEITERKQTPCLYPLWEYERFGIEDVRISSIKSKKYVITYVCPHRNFGVSTAFLMTKNFQEFESIIKEDTPRPIIISIKDVAIFPEKVPSPYETDIIKKDDKVYATLLRPNAFDGISKPGIWVAYSPDLVHWGPPHRLTIPEKGEITGTGSPLIKLDGRWIGSYHEIIETKKRREYRVKLISLNKKYLWKDCKTSEVLLKREDYRDILPEDGYTKNVVYPTGMIINDEITSLFSGIDDTWTVMDKFYTKDIIKFIEK